MNSDHELNAENGSKNSSKKGGYSKASFILSAAPIAILLIGFLLCLFVSAVIPGGGSSVWWLFIILLYIVVPIAIITNILSVIFGIIGLKSKKTVFAWAGIGLVAIEAISILLTVGIIIAVNTPEKNARDREIAQQQKEISNYETYADLRPFGLGHYKLRCEGDSILWDITKTKSAVTQYKGTSLVFEYCFNRREEASWDVIRGNSNAGKDVLYDVYFYEGTYIIVTPLWEEPDPLYCGYIYLCKRLDKDTDLFGIGISDLQTAEKLQTLPGEQISRKELAALLGKEF